MLFRSEQQHMIERLFARARRLNKNRKLPANFFLADVFVKLLRPQRALQRLFLFALALGLDQAIRRAIVRPYPCGCERVVVDSHTAILLGDPLVHSHHSLHKAVILGAAGKPARNPPVKRKTVRSPLAGEG